MAELTAHAKSVVAAFNDDDYRQAAAGKRRRAFSVPLDVQLASARNIRIKVSVPGGFNNAPAVGAVTFAR